MAMSNCPGMHGIGGVAVGIGVGAGVAVGVGAAVVGVCDTSGPPPLDAGVEEPQAATMPTAATSTVETRTRRIGTQGTRNSGATRITFPRGRPGPPAARERTDRQ